MICFLQEYSVPLATVCSALLGMGGLLWTHYANRMKDAKAKLRGEILSALVGVYPKNLTNTTEVANSIKNGLPQIQMAVTRYSFYLKGSQHIKFEKEWQNCLSKGLAIIENEMKEHMFDEQERDTHTQFSNHISNILAYAE